ncbi:hypothetical protein GCM10011529_19820 [Polymorphobacter glacialis]|uniref:DUF1440 domain-containing protein n=1 Tax=Sandarakinorhabdus glacialis TaxID=1614636 RepID=A0A916ZUJ3_9SPHN|nr:DUF1440 domain-containing protein [Polymorphobacter glacialis]GGE13480.1 hypothetical protein GCM10011529_19820 [Polymorphobacter glacialis]
MNPMPLPHRRFAATDDLRGLAAGAIAGLFASAAMSVFQAMVSDLLPKSDDPPATEIAADKTAEAVTGSPVPENSKAVAGEAVHYAFGMGLGALYGMVAERERVVTFGGGSAFGIVTALGMDDVVVPALDLAPSPAETPPALHVYAIVSHLVFGFTTEAVRRLLRG